MLVLSICSTLLTVLACTLDPVIHCGFRYVCAVSSMLEAYATRALLLGRTYTSCLLLLLGSVAAACWSWLAAHLISAGSRLSLTVCLSSSVSSGAPSAEQQQARATRWPSLHSVKLSKSCNCCSESMLMCYNNFKYCSAQPDLQRAISCTVLGVPTKSRRRVQHFGIRCQQMLTASNCFQQVWRAVDAGAWFSQPVQGVSCLRHTAMPLQVGCDPVVQEFCTFLWLPVLPGNLLERDGCHLPH